MSPYGFVYWKSSDSERQWFFFYCSGIRIQTISFVNWNFTIEKYIFFLPEMLFFKLVVWCHFKLVAPENANVFFLGLPRKMSNLQEKPPALQEENIQLFWTWNVGFFSGFFFKAFWPSFLAVLGIRNRIRRICMFLGLLDPDPLVTRYGSGSGPYLFLINVLNGLK